MQHDETLMLAVSDLHCGSTVGLTPPDFPLLDDGAWKLNKVQDWIWQQWSGFVSWAKTYADDRPLVLLLNGDLIEGVHHGTKEVVHADPGIHARMAVECLLPLARIATRIYVVRGTGAHVGHSSEDSIARTLGAVSDGGIFAKHHWMFRVQDTVVSAKHHISTSSRRALRGTSLSINLEEERAECAAASYQMPDLLIRSHRHVYGHYSTEESQIVVTPAWQALTSYGWKVVPNAVPRIGGVMIDWNLSSAPVVVPWTRTPERNVV